MKEKFWKRLPLVRLHAFWGLLFTLPLAVLEALLALAIQPGSLETLLLYLREQPVLAFLNFLPFWLINLGFWFLFSDPFFAAAAAGGLGGVLSLVNRTMVEKRDEPFSPKDIALIKEAGNAMQSYDMNLHLPSVLAIVGFVLAMVVLGVLLRGKRPFRKRWGNVCFALLGALVSFGVLTGCIQQVYSSRELYESFPVKNRYYIAGVYEQLGFPYCFCYNFNTYLVEKPEGYSTGQAKAYEQEHPAKKGQGKAVNVVMVMNEAFSDVTNQEILDYPAGEEPLRFYNSLKTSDRAVTGHIVVPNYGAGTANTEFDVITGMQTNFISESGASAFRVLHRDIDSIFRVFLEDGYQTEFIHPGQDWFYNRQNVYRYFGAEKLLFSEAFEDAERMGGWVMDSAVLDVMKEEFEAAMEAGKPYFNYTVTIQNHMSYSHDKYGEYRVHLVPLKREIDAGARTRLSVYAKGAKDADDMLRGLTEYYESREEPVMLVFFGDHLPNLGDSYQCYHEIGMEVGEGKDPVTTLRTYETPYVIWVNSPAAELLDFSARKEALGLPEDGMINANFLGAMTLELTGRREENSFFSYLNDLRRELPVLHNGTGRTGEGEYFEELPEEYAEDIKKLRFWEYYRLSN